MVRIPFHAYAHLNKKRATGNQAGLDERKSLGLLQVDENNTRVIKSSLKIRCFSVMKYQTIMTENQKLTFTMGPWKFKELVEIKCFQIISRIILKVD